MLGRLWIGLMIIVALGNRIYPEAAPKPTFHGQIGFDLNFTRVGGPGRDLSYLRSRQHKTFLDLKTSWYGFNLALDLKWDSDQHLSTQKYYNTGMVLSRWGVTLGLWDFSASSLIRSNRILSPRKITGLGINWAISSRFKFRVMGGQTVRKIEGEYDTTGHYLRSAGTYSQKIILAGVEGNPHPSLTLAIHALHGFEDSKSIRYGSFYYDANWAYDLIAGYKFRQSGYLNLEIARTDVKKHYTLYTAPSLRKTEDLTAQYNVTLESGLSFRKQQIGIKLYRYDNGFKSLGNMYQSNDMEGFDLRGSGNVWRNRIIYSWQARRYQRDLTLNSDQQKKYLNLFANLDFRPHRNWGISSNYSYSSGKNSIDSAQTTTTPSDDSLSRPITLNPLDMTFSNLYLRLMMKQERGAFSIQLTPFFRLNQSRNDFSPASDSKSSGPGITALLTIHKRHQIEYRLESSKTRYPNQHHQFSTMNTSLNFRSPLMKNRLNLTLGGTLVNYTGQQYYGNSTKTSANLTLQWITPKYGELSLGGSIGDFDQDEPSQKKYHYSGLQCSYTKRF